MPRVVAAQPIAIIAPRPSALSGRSLGIAISALALTAAGFAHGTDLSASPTSLANIEIETAEPVSIRDAVASNEIAPAPSMVRETSIAEWYPVPVHDGIRLDVAFTSLGGWIHPVTNSAELMPERSTRHFGATRVGVERSECGSGHCGVDLDGPRGRPLVAVAAGTVVRVERKELGSDGRSGRYVRLQHDDGTLTAYMHMDDVAADLQVGDYVRGGQYIGTLGATAVYSAAPHLHFSLEVPKHPGASGDGIETTYVDPAPFLVRAKIVTVPERRHAIKPAF
ncbi:MAG: M23 family metallopeptidase [Deltaproteobacteria bacterium]|nr:M23 family metallopeptidase [Deltaproteobacteria bacterium]